MCLSVALLTLPAPAAAQDASSTQRASRDTRAAGTMVDATRFGGLLRASGAGILTATAREEDGGVSVPGEELPAAPILAAAGDGAATAPLFRRASALERGWSLVGRGALVDGDGSDRYPEAADLLPGGGEGADEGSDEAPFLVRLFDARDLMLWVRDAREWGEEARRVVFGPRGIVRAGSVPGSDRPRVRLELTDSRPGAQVVIITR